MTDVTGKNLAVNWIYTGGTISITPDYRSFNMSDNVDMAETTAGSDADKTYIATIKDSTVDLSFLYQSKGTALDSALAVSTAGTLQVYPEGTATGNPVITYPAIVSSYKKAVPYNEVVAVDVTFQKSGAKSVA
jgi:hypothetical protein